MVGKGAVLLTVKHLKKCGGRVALVIGAELVYLVKQNYGIFCACGLDSRNNSARH